MPDLKRSATPESLSHYEAVRLFIERAQATQPSFCVTNANAPAVAQICHRLDGIPYAIELAAAKVRVLSTEQINVRLDDCFRLLTGGSRTALPRQQTLRTMLDWSYDLLSAEEQTLLRRLSVFTGGGTLEAAEAVCADLETAWPDSIPMNLDEKECPDCAEIIKAKARKCKHCGYEFAPVVVPLFASPPVPVAPPRLESGEIVDLLSHLVDKSLVVYEENASGQGRYRLLETVRQYARDRLLESGAGEALRDRHLLHFLAVAEWAGREMEEDEQRRAWLERLEAEHENLRAALEWSLEGPNRSERSEAGLKIGTELTSFWWACGYWEEGRAWLARLLERTQGAPGQLRSLALGAAGTLANAQGDVEAARRHWEERLRLARELGDENAVAKALRLLGILAARRQAFAEARALYEESRVLSRKIGDASGESQVEHLLANVLRLHGDYEAARVLYEKGLTRARQAGSSWAEAEALRALGNVAWHVCDWAEARQRHETALAIWRRRGSTAALPEGLYNLAEVDRCAGELASARMLYEESIAGLRELNSQPALARALTGLGNVERASGNLAHASALLREGLELQRQCRSAWGIANSLRAFATLAAEEGRAARAARLWGASAVLHESISSPLPPAERPDDERCRERARADLGGEEAFTAAFAEGQAMTLNQAVAYALEEKSS